MSSQRYSSRVLLIELIAVLIALLFLSPFYFIIANSLKPFGQIIKNAASFPHTLDFQNYVKAWN
ncbi:MAG TPA: carbohydrate ABC transporter permease, partial [Spirochaetia bacterium]|nr:carbohydrate ABC transporter permease [Spirochaetia bacterium]